MAKMLKGNLTASEVISKIHRAYLVAGANLIKTNTFSSLPWVLDEYGLSEITYGSAKEGNINNCNEK